MAEAVAEGKPLPASADCLLAAVVTHERRMSPALDGRTCAGRAPRPRQLSLRF